MTDMSKYHVNDYWREQMTITQLNAAQGEIIRNLDELRVLCDGTLITVDTYWRVVESERLKYDAITRRIRELQATDGDTVEGDLE